MKMQFRRSVRLLTLVLLVSAVLSFASCTQPRTASPSVTDIPDTTTQEAVTPLPDSTPHGDTSDPDGTTEDPPESEPQTTKEQTTPEPPMTDPVLINRLTGEATDAKTANRRPLAIMINNVKKAIPQIGISHAMVMYECETEGGITRLMMLTTDYESLPVVGSIRSAREYFIDYAMGHDAIFMHAGASYQAYVEMGQRGVDNIDGSKGNHPYDTFYRDPNRLQTMGSVHSLVTTGDRIEKAVAYRKFRTELKSNAQTTFSFVAPDTVMNLDSLPGVTDAEHLYMRYTASQCPEYVFDAKTNTYLRYQQNHVPHIDAANNTQLSFTNVLILSCVRTYTNDAQGHIDLTTTGEGKGYYAYGGKAIPIVWKKANDNAPLRLYCQDGSELRLNVGKTFVNVLSESQFAKLQLNYKK